MRFNFRLPLPVKFAALILVGAVFVVEPILGARAELAAAPGGIAFCTEDHSPIVDRLLPEGVGGTVLVDDLGEAAGDANQLSGTIRLALDADLSGDSGASIELHERAHLLEFARPDVVARLMRGQPAPAKGQDAAKDAAEHFAEMAGEAWKITGLLMPGDFCLLDSPEGLLSQIEAKVPGTAGFVVWYLRDPVLAAADGADALRAEADRLIRAANRLSDWDAIYAAIRERQKPDGTFATWPVYSVREYLERRQTHLRLAGGFSARIESAQIGASLTLLGLAGR